MAHDGKPRSIIHRQLAPTVGPATSGVSFREGILGGIGKTITVGTAIFGEPAGYIVDDNSYMPANDYLVSACILPIGSHSVFIGMTAKALGLRRESRIFPPTILPVEEGFDAGFGSDLAYTYVGADRDLILAGRQADDIANTHHGKASAEYHYIGMIGTNEVNMTESSEPDSILPVINGRVDSEGGSGNTTNLGEASDSEESDFESQVHNAFAGNREVMMTQPTVPQKDEKAEEKANPPNAAGEQDIASKEAKDAEAAAADPDAKADEATVAKNASDEKEAEKKKSKAERKAAEKAGDKAARAATKPPRVYEKGEPSTRFPKHYTWTDKDEMELLLTPIPKDESPQMLELR